MGSEQIPRFVGQLVRNPSEAADAREVLGVEIGIDVLAPNGDGSQLQNLPPGPPGPAGEGDKNYTYQQMSASNTWNITHNLGKYPSVVITDSADNIVYGDVYYLDSNSIRVTFTSSFAGTAYLN